MARGADLTARDVERAIEYTRGRHPRPFLQRIQSRMGYRTATGAVDDAFVRAVADWQEARLGAGTGDGKIGPATEAHLHLLLPEAERAVQAARDLLARGGYLYDGWDNDLRDNDGNGLLDAADPGEARAQDGQHYGQTFHRFWVRRGTYRGGWSFAPGTVTVASDREIRGTFRYRNCADIISEAYRAAHVMPHYRHTEQILNEFRRRGYVWQRSGGYPDQYLPGDFICTLVPGHGGHSGIVVLGEPTHGGAQAPLVIDLPGPSSQISDGAYDPACTNDLQCHRWPSFRIAQVPTANQFLGRLLRSRLHGHR